jgi:hypothetical protein
VTLVFPPEEWYRMVDSRTCVLSTSVCQHSSYIFRYHAYMHNHSIQILMMQLLPCIC